VPPQAIAAPPAVSRPLMSVAQPAPMPAPVARPAPPPQSVAAPAPAAAPASQPQHRGGERAAERFGRDDKGRMQER
jgi:hypothetical protein